MSRYLFIKNSQIINKGIQRIQIKHHYNVWANNPKSTTFQVNIFNNPE